MLHQIASTHRLKGSVTEQHKVTTAVLTPRDCNHTNFGVNAVRRSARQSLRVHGKSSLITRSTSVGFTAPDINGRRLPIYSKISLNSSPLSDSTITLPSFVFQNFSAQAPSRKWAGSALQRAGALIFPRVGEISLTRNSSIFPENHRGFN